MIIELGFSSTWPIRFFGSIVDVCVVAGNSSEIIAYATFHVLMKAETSSYNKWVGFPSKFREVSPKCIETAPAC